MKASQRARLPALLLTMLTFAGCPQGRMDYAAALKQAEELVQTGAYEEAYRLFDQLRQQYPEELEPYRDLAWTANRLGRPGDAISVLEERVARGGPGIHTVHDALATLLDQTGRRQEAEHHYREALRLQADYAPSYRHLSRLLARSGRYPESLEVLREGLDRISDDPQLRTRYAEALIKLRRRWAEAERELLVALALPDPGWYPHYLLGIVYLNTGKPAQARRELETATELEPGSVRAWYQLANACERLGNSEARDAALEQFADRYRRQLDPRS